MLRQGSGVLDKQLFRRGRELDATRGRSVLDNGPTESKERAGNPGRRQPPEDFKETGDAVVRNCEGLLAHRPIRGFMGKMATTSQPSASSRSARPPVSQPQAVILQAEKTQSPAGGRLPRRSGTSVHLKP